MRDISVDILRISDCRQRKTARKCVDCLVEFFIYSIDLNSFMKDLYRPSLEYADREPQ